MSADQTLVIYHNIVFMYALRYESIPGCIEYCVGYYLLLNYSFTDLNLPQQAGDLPLTPTYIESN